MGKVWSDFSPRNPQVGCLRMAPSHIKLHVILLLIVTILQGMHYNWENLYYEILIPRNLMTFRGLKEQAKNVTYVLPIQGK